MVPGADILPFNFSAAVQKAESEQTPSGHFNSTTGQRSIAFSTSQSTVDSGKNVKRPSSGVTLGQYGGGFGGPRKRIDLGRAKGR